MRSDRVHRIAIVLPGLKLGGAERLIEEQVRVSLAEELPFEFVVIACSAQGDDMTERLLPLGCPVLSLPAGRLNLLRSVASLRAVLRRERVDLVHAHLPRAGIVTRLAVGRHGRLPHLYTEHNEQGSYHPVIRALNAGTLHWPDITVAVSGPVREGMLRAAPRLRDVPGSCMVIPNGVDLRQLRAGGPSRVETRRKWGIPETAAVVGLLGHFRPEKGHDVLLRAVAALPPDACWVVFAGRDDGTESAVLRLCDELRLGDRVRFLGFQRDVASLLAAVDILAMPSTREGLPVALLEAMALGVPVVATPAGGISDVLRSGENGLLVPIGDTAGLSVALAALLADAGRRRALGAAGCRTVEDEFDVRVMVQRYSDVYHRLLLHARDL